jgi:hypothetical protein
MTATLLVHLDNPDTGAVSFKPADTKGARWRKARSIYEASRLADDVMPEATADAPRVIDYVEAMS